MSGQCQKRGFTLVELLVVIGIIALLISILLPALSRARESANTIKCSANLRSVGQGMAQYLANNKGTFPAAYIYAGMQIVGGVEKPTAADQGYIHWSSFIYKSGRAISDPNVFKSTSGWEMFQCPSIPNGGLPPTNTIPQNLDANQSNDDGEGVVDQQAPRCSYTVNEAICPRNKFVIGFQGALRPYQFVRAVKNSAGTVLATEWNPNWRIVSDAGRSDPGSTVCKSHRPIHGFVGMTGELNMELVAPDPFAGRPTYRRAKVSDLGGDPQAARFSSRLDWVGRNHGKKVLKNGFDERKSNFLYVDGHVETKGIKETLSPKFEWGEKFYTLNPNGDMAPD